MTMELKQVSVLVSRTLLGFWIAHDFRNEALHFLLCYTEITHSLEGLNGQVARLLGHFGGSRSAQADVDIGGAAPALLRGGARVLRHRPQARRRHAEIERTWRSESAIRTAIG